MTEEHHIDLLQEPLPELDSPPPFELPALTDIRHYQREPSDSDFPPPGVARSSLASPEERIRRLEELVEALGTMLDMVKEQVGSISRGPEFTWTFNSIGGWGWRFMGWKS